jgi:hypothetical protein
MTQPDISCVSRLLSLDVIRQIDWEQTFGAAHEKTRFRDVSCWRDGLSSSLVACRTCATAGDAGDRISKSCGSRRLAWRSCRSIPQGLARCWICRGRECDDRLSLGGESKRPPTRARCRPGSPTGRGHCGAAKHSRSAGGKGSRGCERSEKKTHGNCPVLGRVDRPVMSALRQTAHFADVVKWTRTIPKRDGRASKSRLAGRQALRFAGSPWRERASLRLLSAELYCVAKAWRRLPEQAEPRRVRPMV